jgi:peptidoglycan/xylan/chitin deacetylase (PgdA/CDA1 family)
MPPSLLATYDDGPSPEFTQKRLLVEQHGIFPVWFCQGNHLQLRADSVIDAIRSGHIIGNHAVSHPHFGDITIEQGIAEIRETDAIIDDLYQRAGVKRLHKFFRFPFGEKGDGGAAGSIEKRQAYQTCLRDLGYTPPCIDDLRYPDTSDYAADADWYWTHDPTDWGPFNLNDAPENRRTPEQVVAGMRDWDPQAAGVSVHVIVMHDMAGPVGEQLFSNLVDVLVQKNLPFHRC